MLTNEDITKHTGMVYKLAGKYFRQVRDPAIDFDDLLSEAYLGLVRAYERFDPGKGFAFSTFAFKTIAGYLQSFLDRKGSQIRFPNHTVLLGNKINNLGLADESPDEIARQMGVSDQQAQQALDYLQQRMTISLDKPLNESKSNVPDPESDHWNLAQAEDDLSRIIAGEFIDHLDLRDRQIVEFLMQGYNRREIGKALGISHQAVWQRICRKIQPLYTKFENGSLRKGKAKMPVTKDGPACGLTKQILIEEIAKGETLSSIERAWGMKYNTIHSWVKKWDLKGITQAKAQDMLSESKQPIMREKDVKQNDAVKAEVYQQTAEMLKKEKSALEEDLTKVRSELEQAVSKIYDLERQLSLSREANCNLKDKYDLLLQEREEYKRNLEEFKKLPAVLLEPSDPVNHPLHYTRGDIECIDAIEAATAGLSGPEAYSTGAAIKYLWRWKYKNGREDLQKAAWYVNRLIGE
ncbi:sigma-70 family RNA polymerase sigma factor [Paenibacillus lactis]|uniref:sigma-70 family RNA polymerase sigma factor n=1 Tax=Paenibacillus lactis TaxID=228574 RepID=UPI001B150EF1|nr:sigma-70 family RNA polymerase sigma factor [Paenibacillus lactis]GIO90761.1 hypothetical protein J31TS3_19880 [Paenibacillus lactis]